MRGRGAAPAPPRRGRWPRVARSGSALTRVCVSTDGVAALHSRGLLAKVRDDQALGAPNVFRVAAKALRAAGFATVEAMRSAVTEVVSAEERMRLMAHGVAPHDDGAPTELAAS